MITDKDDLRRAMPGMMKDLQGQPAIDDRLAAPLESAEAELFELDLPGLTPEDLPEDALKAARHYLASRVLAEQTGNLNLILTPNGFGVVSTQQVAPASRERTDALRRTLLAQAGRAYDRLLRLTSALASLDRDRSRTRSLVLPLMVQYERLSLYPELTAWERRQRLYPQVAYLTDQVRGDLTGSPLLAAVIESMIFPRDRTTARLTALIETAVTRALEDRRPLRTEDYMDAADMLLGSEGEVYELWSGAGMEDIWKPEVFRNERKDTGYWF